MTEEIIPYLIQGAAFLGIIVSTFIVVRIFVRLFSKYIRLSSGILANDPTNYQFIQHTITGLIYIVGIGSALYTLPPFRSIAGSMLTGAGILALVAGFASQQVLSNIVSGFFIVVFKPFRVNDRLRVGADLMGIVEDITLRHTVIRNFQNQRIVIPNAIISNETLVNFNMTDDRNCQWINVGISYDSDVQLAKEIMREEAMKHPLVIDNRNAKQLEEGADIVTVRVVALADSSVQLRAWAWANNAADGFVVECDLLESIKARFDAAGIEIPFPHRTLVYKNQPADK